MTTASPALSARAPAFNPIPTLSQQLELPVSSVAAVVALLEGGATVPFIARYRKEATGGLDEVQIRLIEEKRTYVLELEARRHSILDEIDKQGKLTPALKSRILAATQKQELEDLYLPFKPKRRTRGMIARERGLEALGLRVLLQPLDGTPETEALAYVNAEKEVPDVKTALQGARDIAAEAAAENADVRAAARHLFMEEGLVSVDKAPSVTGPTKFEMYYDFSEPAKTIPSHRFLAARRGEVENVLRVKLVVDEEKAQAQVASLMRVNAKSPWAGQLQTATQDAWKRLIAPSVETDVRVELKLRADREAVEVFAGNLRALLLAAPLGGRTVIGIDPGQRTGCKTAVVDHTGKLLEHTVLYLVQGEDSVRKSEALLLHLIEKHKPHAVAVGNGTHGRETESFVRDALKKSAIKGIFPVMVNEAGASVYSASDVAREEFPDLDLTVRGAISIARRLQDPLAELVKVDPKSIGVGQYQHDVFQPLLGKKLDDVVQSCVNLVGVELNTASASLLAYVAGIGPTLSRKIVEYRNHKGAFQSRAQLREVSGLGPRAFEQCAGFLRIPNGQHALDGSAVHPERYALVERMALDLGVAVGALLGNAALAAKVAWQKYVTPDVGEPTLKDILMELKKPGRDPRETFEPPAFRDDVRTMEDLKPGMTLEGVVTNVTAFGAFVDIGVHQDGLVHVSQLSDQFVKEPKDVVKAGDKLKVRVLEIDMARKRIALTAKSGEGPSQGAFGKPAAGPGRVGSSSVTTGGGQPRKGGAGAQQDFENRPFARLLLK